MILLFRIKSIKILLMFLVCILIVKESFSQDENNYSLKLRSDQRVSIYINSIFISEGISFDTTLKSGSYNFSFSFSEGTIWPSLVLDTVINLSCDTVIHISAPVKIRITSNPDDAKVFHNSKLYGYTPGTFILRDYLSKDSSIITLQKGGYLSSGIPMKSDTASKTYHVNLIPDGQNDNHSFINRNLKYFILGSAAIFGGLSSYFKQVANDYYLGNSSSEEVMNKVRRYDNLSAAFSVLLQIDFGILIYLLLTE